jgi:hypothetical protein
MNGSTYRVRIAVPPAARLAPPAPPARVRGTPRERKAAQALYLRGSLTTTLTPAMTPVTAR